MPPRAASTTRRATDREPRRTDREFQVANVKKFDDAGSRAAVVAHGGVRSTGDVPTASRDASLPSATPQR